MRKRGDGKSGGAVAGYEEEQGVSCWDSVQPLVGCPEEKAELWTK